MEATLNSEGITFKRPKQGPSKRMTGKRSSASAEDPVHMAFLRTFEGPTQTIPRRISLYSKYLEVLKGHLQNVQEKYNEELNGSLDKFIVDSFQMIDKNHNVVPVGVLESGLSAAENSTMFDYIQKKLRTDEFNQKVLVTRIQSGTGSSTKAVFQKIFSQIRNEPEGATTGEDSDDTLTEINTINDKNCSLYDLKSFLASVNSKYKIFILAEDIEYFSHAVITQLLKLMGCSDLPIVFLFGATHGQFINNLVPLNSSTEFLIEKFYSVTPNERLDNFMRRVLFDYRTPFKISGRIASYLESHYQEYNYSVDSIFNSIKFCLRHHFLTPKSAFCSLENQDAYSEDELISIKQCLSNNEQSPRKRPKNQSSVKPEDLLASSIDKLTHWNFCLRLVSYINLRLQELPLGDTYSRMYSSFCIGFSNAKNNDDDPLSKFFKSLLGISKHDLELIITECIELLKRKNLPDIDLVSTAGIRFQKLADDLVEEKKEKQENNDRSEADIKTSTLRLRKKKQSLQELQNSILELKRKNEGTSTFHVIRTELVDYLKSLLKQFAPPLETDNFLSIFVFDDLNHLINSMFPANFLQLNEDVSKPGFSLQCECCSSLEAASVVETLPDTSIIHKLVSEHTTKKVDLNLIYNSFVGIVQIQQSGRKSKTATKHREAATASYLIRFRRAVGELQHMGFIKRSKSKPDEISRLTWW